MGKWKIVIIIFFALDLGYSFLQHYHQPLDGDMSNGIVPAAHVQKILENPLGGDAILNNESYPNPNRYFSHWAMWKYYNTVPEILSDITSPINSIYLSNAIIKTLIQITIWILLTVLITRQWRVTKNTLITGLIILPLFQTNGYQSLMGIIDASATYTFFYAAPLILVILLILPLIFYSAQNKEIPIWVILPSIPAAIVSSLSGPLNPAITMISVAIISIWMIRTKGIRSIINPSAQQATLTAYLLPITLLSIYSLYLGTYNSNNVTEVSILDQYTRLPLGLYYLLTDKLGYSLLAMLVLINLYFLKKKSLMYNDVTSETIWILAFSLMYVLLLPLGGYRHNRPYIIRYDTIMPVTICLIYLAARSSLIIYNSEIRHRNICLTLTGILLGVFTLADKPGFNKNECERYELMKISSSTEKTIAIDKDCLVLSWAKISNPESSGINMEMLANLGIADRSKRYYNQQ